MMTEEYLNKTALPCLKKWREALENDELALSKVVKELGLGPLEKKQLREWIENEVVGDPELFQTILPEVSGSERIRLYKLGRAKNYYSIQRGKRKSPEIALFLAAKELSLDDNSFKELKVWSEAEEKMIGQKKQEEKENKKVIDSGHSDKKSPDDGNDDSGFSFGI